MDYMKMLQSGLKSAVIAFMALLGTLLIGIISYAMGYKPDGQIAQLIMQYGIVPLLALILGMLNNWQKHKSDK